MYAQLDRALRPRAGSSLGCKISGAGGNLEARDVQGIMTGDSTNGRPMGHPILELLGKNLLGRPVARGRAETRGRAPGLANEWTG